LTSKRDKFVRPIINALLDGLIDYAGLFPPAKLDMATTVRNYARYLEHEDGWMMNRLIVPVPRLDEFETHAATLLPRADRDGGWRISALTVAANDTAGLQRDLDRIAEFNEMHADVGRGLAVIDTIELKAASAREIEDSLNLFEDEMYPFFELSASSDPRGLIATLVGSDAGAKIRTGGVTADLYPSVEHTARFIVACARSGVPFKATAGMHHPLRHYNDAVKTHEHGFLNVFIGAALADRCEDVEESDVQAALEATSIDAFAIEDETISFGGHTVLLEGVERARDMFAVSFGSCSFDEPRDDLRGLGLL
jgi:hypothetical protein